jgi:hypothetical protein
VQVACNVAYPFADTQPALINVQKPLSVPRYPPSKERTYTSQTGCRAIAATWEVARVFAIEAE